MDRNVLTAAVTNNQRASRKGELKRLIERLTDHYDFQCEGGPLRLCVDFQKLCEMALNPTDQVCGACGKQWDGEACDQVNNFHERAVCFPIDAPVSETEPAFEEKPSAWLIERADGSKDVVLTPLTDQTFIDYGDTATPLHAAVWKDEEMQAARRRAELRQEWFLSRRSER